MSVVDLTFGAQFLFVLLFGGGAGLPLGLPPQPEDRVLAKVAPDECLYYTRWSAMATADAESPNQTEQLLAEPEIRTFMLALETGVKQGLALAAQSGDDATVALAAKLAPELGKILLTHATTVFISEVQFEPEGPKLRGAIVVNLGDAEKEVQDAIDAVRRRIAKQAEVGVERVEISGSPFDRMRPDPRMPTITWGIHQKYFVLGLGKDSVEGVVDRMQTPAPQWLDDVESQMPVARRATLTYCNLAKLRELLLALAADAVSAETVDALGLGNLESYQLATGLSATRFTSTTRIVFDGKPNGLLKLVADQPLDRDDLAQIPADATIALAMRCDVGQAFDTLTEMLGKVSPDALRQFEQGLEHFRQMLQIDVRKDLFGSLGDVWRIYTSPREGGLLTGWTAVVSIRDRAKLQQTNDRLIAFLRQLADQIPSFPRVKATEFQGKTFYSLLVPKNGFLVTPSWCLADDQFLLALFPQPIKTYLSRTENEPSLAGLPEIAAEFDAGRGPTAIGYQDTAALLRVVYPLVQLGARQAAAALQQQNIDVDVSLLPSANTIGRHLRPSVMSVRRTDDGWRTDSQQTMPSGSVGATAPVLTALLLPAVQAARSAARRSQGMNNLKQIVLAMHNYHDTYGSFPAAYNTDKEGKPLLSWRVHVLPFLEEQELYNQFHLDEPWSSPHNRKLIRQMPELYRAPGSHADPGKTNYLGLAGEHGIFLPPKKGLGGGQHPTGVGMRMITDGTSHTVAMVEASDAVAVIWTKPDDFEPDEDDPMRGLVGVRPGGFLAALCDGSVRFIARSVDETVLRALFTRDGGEAVQLP